MTEIRPLLPDHWSLLKTVRLQALADSPEAFGMTLAEASARTDAEWQENARRFTRLPPAASFLAYDNGVPCGMVNCFASSEDSQTAEMTAFWVAPHQRGQGVAEALVAAVVEWAAARGFAMLEAAVVEDNHRAIAFYKKVGFRGTDQSEPFRSNPSKRIVRLALAIGTRS